MTHEEIVRATNLLRAISNASELDAIKALSDAFRNVLLEERKACIGIALDSGEGGIAEAIRARITPVLAGAPEEYRRLIAERKDLSSRSDLSEDEIRRLAHLNQGGELLDKVEAALVSGNYEYRALQYD